MEGERSKTEKNTLQEVKNIWYTNINGLMSKRLEVEEFLQRIRPDMMILCETKWKKVGGTRHR